VKGLRKNRSGFVRFSFDGEDMTPTRYRRDEGVFPEASEGGGYGLQIVVREPLVGKNEDVMFKPCVAKIADQVWRKSARQVDACDLGAAGLTARFDPYHPFASSTRISLMILSQGG
jgi:hypothetical protein